MLKWIFKYKIYYLIAAILLMVAAYFISNQNRSEHELNEAIIRCEKVIGDFEKQFYQRFTDEYLATSFSYKKLTKEEITTLHNLPFETLVYKNDSLLFWSNNYAIPLRSGDLFNDGIGFQDFKNGYFISAKKSLNGKSGKSLAIIALTEVKANYSTTNGYLRNHFQEAFDLPSYITVSANPNSSNRAVKSGDGQILFYIGIDENEKKDQAGVPATICFFLSLFLLIIFISQLLRIINNTEGNWINLLFIFVFYFLLVFFLSNNAILPRSVGNWKIFNPELFASGGIASSLGALLIQMLMLLWICIYISGSMNFRLGNNSRSTANYLYHLFGYILIFTMAIYCANVFQALVKDSLIEFAFLNPIEPDYISILGVLCISMLLFCLFLLSEKIVVTLEKNKLNVTDRILLLLICSLMAIAYYLETDFGISGLLVIFWINLFIFLLPLFAIGRISKLNIIRIFMVVIFFCLSGSALLFYYGKQKELQMRENYAKKLVTDRDAVTEFLLNEVQGKISRDPFIKKYFETPQVPGKNLEDRLRQIYFLEGFERYSLKFYPFDRNGYLLYSGENEFGNVTERGIKQNFNSLGVEKLFYNATATGNITYLAQYDIESSDTLLGRLYVELNASGYNNAGVYPELLLTEKDKLPDVTPAYSYAIYSKPESMGGKSKNDSAFQLVDQEGTYNYDYRLPWKITEDEIQDIDQANFNHLIYHPKKHIVIVVTNGKIPALYFLSYFSFLFVMIFILVAIILFFNMVILNKRVNSFTDVLRYASLRTLIHTFFMVFILLMLLIIGYVTGRFFLRQFNTLAKTTVIEKMNRVASSVVYLFKQNGISNPDDPQISSILRNQIGQIAEVQGNEVNFYNRTGDLITSSQPGIFEKGIISRKINPLAYYDLRKETQTMLVTEEQIGKLSFFSGYQTIRNEKGRVLVYLNLPYYNSRENLNEQVGFFFLALVNILVIATIIAGLMAPFISRQITQKLSLIGEKFKNVKVGTSNELIEWHADDEIGSLVNEYNKMITELKKSADKLIHTEREMAWREMAKQVAHEIKNPLTPMKLSIQHLQRAYAQNAPNMKELTASVSKTLIEQIDNLSEIATAFSNFAKMPKAEIEDVDVNEVLKSVCELHKEASGARVLLHSNAELAIVAADKNQLISVFNNLIINAIQAIPEERMGRVDVITENTDGQLVVSITDDGIGISETEAEKVFVPNFTTKSSGTGLGLALCKNMIENFNGSISFTSIKNVGTTFYVKLPIVEKT